ncbi:uncharacterized protein LOC115626448 isoform X2 [Scaptodrosophila lebanonensis]|uniref:Uncharacterized protein LOC115626448 isoform X2 n=1 Tax=Drosophila lebanonensis TaxID=7225 RepID=A0A6J2TNR2_DROLE|nr:uncharacterized protein LOC115626448 isoform X2 [Scaptodrosophila lebanonensis]
MQDVDNESPSKTSNPGWKLFQEKKSNRNTRLRYYTSFEEMYLVELWRHHVHEIPGYDETFPIFRTIANGMCERNSKLNKQEVKRRIRTYKNKFENERRRMQNDPTYKTSWRLYPLINCILELPSPPPDVLHEQKTLESIERMISAEVSDLPSFYPNQSFKTVNATRDPDGCPFLEVEQQPVTVKSEQAEPLNTQIKMEPNEASAVDDFSNSQQNGEWDADDHTRKPLTPANRTLPSTITYSTGRRGSRRRSFFPRPGAITMAQILNLRMENQLMAEQRDAQLKELRLKQNELKLA